MIDPELPLTLHAFPADPCEIADFGFGPFPLEGQVQAILSHTPPADWAATGIDRSAYLDLAEPIVRMAAAWVDDAGAVIDPVMQQEWGQTSPRFAASAAVLIRCGRCPEILDLACQVMERCCRLMAEAAAKEMSPDFWMRELVTADLCLDGIAQPARQAAWRRDLMRVEPEALYRFVDPEHGAKMAGFHNWAVYSSGGEALRGLAGLAPRDADFLCGSAFFDVYMQPQLARFTDHGMYRDPGEPITYDITTRLQIAVPLAFGLQSPWRRPYVELLRRGGLTSLLFCSTEGYVPFGGRSSQFLFQEAMQSALCELEARRYANSDPRLAGAFKRQAHLGARSIRRWILDSEQIRHIKNGYPPQSGHGIDPYGQYSVYSLLAASFLGLATLFADDAIEETPAPAEIGGGVCQLSPAFHKVFANAGGVSIEIDTAADPKHDATGLGRVLFAGAPMEMILAMPISREAVYQLAPGEAPAEHSCAIGPAWTVDGEELILAGLDDGLSSKLAVERADPAEVRLALDYDHAASRSAIRETYRLAEGSLACSVTVSVAGDPASGLVYRVPLIDSDGEVGSSRSLEPGRASVSYRGAECLLRWDPEQVQADWESAAVCNRNGRYRVLRLSSTAGSIAGSIAFELRLVSQVEGAGRAS